MLEDVLCPVVTRILFDGLNEVEVATIQVGVMNARSFLAGCATYFTMRLTPKVENAKRFAERATSQIGLGFSWYWRFRGPIST